MTTLIELAERCEKLTGPCRETDLAIALAVGFSGNLIGGGLVKSAAEFPDQLSSVAHWHGVPEFTTSLDAAMTLIPEGMGVLIIRTARGNCWAEVGDDEMQRSAATPVLALCAASLRARATLDIRP